MVGSDSKVKDIKNFLPVRAGAAAGGVRFSHSIGRENKTAMAVALEPVNNTVGRVEFCAAGDAGHRCAGGHHQVRGRRHLGGDWNPDEPIGFKMYPLALKLVRDSPRAGAAGRSLSA